MWLVCRVQYHTITQDIGSYYSKNHTFNRETSEFSQQHYYEIAPK